MARRLERFEFPDPVRARRERAEEARARAAELRKKYPREFHGKVVLDVAIDMGLPYSTVARYLAETDEEA
jgi:hypothetical protein